MLKGVDGWSYEVNSSAAQAKCLVMARLYSLVLSKFGGVQAFFA